MRLQVCPLFACLLAGLFISSQTSQAEGLQDLDYGTALYELYQERYYSAAVYLDASLQQQKIQHHRQESELILGSTMLYYGMDQEAEKIFQRYANAQLGEISDRAWFYMAKLRYQRGLYEGGLQALLNIRAPLPGEMQQERYRLQAMLLMAMGRYRLAAEVSDKTQRDSDLFALYNRSVAMQRSDRGEEGKAILQQLISLPARTAIEQQLQNKSRIILAQLLESQGENARAIELLHQIPSEDVFFDQALIALAWLYYQQGDNSNAVAATRLLKERNSSDIQAKETWLLEGYVLENADATHEAKKSYDTAVSVYQREIDKVDVAISSLNDGTFLNQLLPQLRGASQGVGWEGQLDLPEKSGPYVAVMLASYPFFEALQNLRDLRYLNSQLLTWREDMPSYRHMLKLRQKRHDQFLPLLARVNDGSQFSEIREQHQVIRRQLDNIESQQDIYQFLDEKQQKLKKRLEQSAELLAKLPQGEARDQYQQRYQRLKGLYEWDLSASFKQRSWPRRKALRQLEKIMLSMDAKRVAMSQAKLTTKQMFVDYETLISAMEQQVEALLTRTDKLYDLQEGELLRLAADALQQYRGQLALYRDQAYYRIALLKDHALNVSEVVQ